MSACKFIRTIILVLVITAVSATAAPASLLPGTKGITITGLTGKATFQVKGGAAFTCKEDKTSGEVISSAESLLLLSFGPNCTAGGLPFKSAGDASGTILAHVEATTCHSVKGTGQFLLLQLLPVKLEVPATKLTLEITGVILGEITPGKTKTRAFTVSLSQKGGEPSVSQCENDAKEILTNQVLLTSTDGGSPVSSALEAEKGVLEFSTAQEFMS
jgi:hypothetical protein